MIPWMQVPESVRKDIMQPLGKEVLKRGSAAPVTGYACGCVVEGWHWEDEGDEAELLPCEKHEEERWEEQS
jgi:hypothetical protein